MLEERAKFSEEWLPIVNKYESTHPYIGASMEDAWLFSRNVNGLPDEAAITQADAYAIAQDAVRNEFNMNLREANVFYFITNPDRPEWRFGTSTAYVALDAHTGEILLIKQYEADPPYYNLSTFVCDIIQ